MAKKWYEYFVEVEQERPGSQPAAQRAPQGRPLAGAPPGQQDAAKTIADIAASLNPPPAPTAKFETAPAAAMSGGAKMTLADIYTAADIKPPVHGYTILKVSEMLNNPHIRQMPPEVKKGSIMVALEAAGVKVEEIIQDAIRRDQALDAFERFRVKTVQDLESRKSEENRKIQAEIDKYVADQKAKLQANLDEVAKQKESLESWRLEKQNEEQRIADCVSYFVTDNPISTVTRPRPTVSEPKTGH
jgi:hypothetical protein